MNISFFIILRNPLASMNYISSNMLTLFSHLVKDSLNENLYYAILAGLNYSVNPNYYGLDLSFWGFNDKMGVLINKVFETISSFQIDPLRFKIIKENVSFT